MRCSRNKRTHPRRLLLRAKERLTVETVVARLCSYLEFGIWDLPSVFGFRTWPFGFGMHMSTTAGAETPRTARYKIAKVMFLWFVCLGSYLKWTFWAGYFQEADMVFLHRSQFAFRTCGNHYNKLLIQCCCGMLIHALLENRFYTYCVAGAGAASIWFHWIIFWFLYHIWCWMMPCRLIGPGRQPEVIQIAIIIPQHPKNPNYQWSSVPKAWACPSRIDWLFSV